ncbi:MAG: type II toxin-antitoxin system RelE/ParE family toxin [Nitrososphaerota archaeon]|jgi:mRNA interferase RelE/StbE|nr:type II toxin-antitoxin system RelE/ParE family toxin [Nitrososphaerota archaeon]
MKKKFKLIYSTQFRKQFNCLDKPVRVRVLRELEILEHNPLAGKALTGDLQGLRSFRVGNYRVIYQLLDYNITIIAIKHRKKVYDT